MLAILNFLNAHNLSIFQPILMIFVSKFMVHRALSDKTYLPLGLLSPLNEKNRHVLILSYLSITLKQSMALSRIVTLSVIEEISSMISIAH